MIALLSPRHGWLLGFFGASLAALAISSREAALVRADGPATPSPAAVDFNRHIRPILSEHCFACHGPDEGTRKAKFRLDTKEGAFAELRDGGHALVAGKAADSVLLERLTAGSNRLMPPPKFNKKLTPEQIALLKRWVEEGAKWSTHWAYVAPTKPALPAVKNESWPKTEIDRFLLTRLESEGLAPSPEADKATLIRRVTFDLTGLPPTPAEVDAFLADSAPDAYEKVVDRLLQSPRYGEHMTRYWLDVARWGDTHGMHLDNYREMWPYRDWLINAFNRNERYDQFIIEQLAGDLLPNATIDQKVASGFNRCHITTGEGGSIAEEVYVRNVLDRVETTGIVFFGMTVGCARCHDHKYDPIRMKDFYQLFAMFNSLDQSPLDGNAARFPPVIKVASPEQLAALDKLEQKVAAIRKTIADEVAKVAYDERADVEHVEKKEPTEVVWIDDALPAGAKSATPWTFVGKPDHPVHSGEKSLRLAVNGLGQHYCEGAAPGLKVGDGDVLFAHVYIDPLDQPKEIMLQWHSDSWKHRAYWGENVIPWGTENTTERVKMGPLPETGKWVRLEVPAAKVGIKPGTVINGWAFTQHGGVSYWDRAGIVTKTPQGEQKFETLTAWLEAQHASKLAGLPQPIQAIARQAPQKRNDTQKKQLRDYFIEHAYAKTRDLFAPLNKQLAEAEKERTDLDNAIPATLVSNEGPPKPAFILKRGEYDQHGDQVERNTPAFLPPLPADAPRNRLGFARWLVAREHPLTARVAVNRFWQQLFGTGLVKTAEDFGSQGEPPSHPELLDWLAVQFMDDGWDVKKTMKRLVMSAAYRQSAKLTKDRLAKDPANRLLSRGPRFRLDAEMLRDQALFAAGLLVEKIGGPSVKPPQPAGLWEAVGFVGSNTARFTADAGHEKVHRRSLYTFWKRTSPPPQMNAFDAPSRESCVVRRERTNTPLQALLLLNETQYVEAARALAERTLKEGGDKVEDRLTFLFRQVATRKPDALELGVLTETLNAHLEKYKANIEAAKKLVAVGETKADAKLDPTEMAAWTMIANLVLNLDEVLNK
jgi:mono/diheme cytochrome c family protein